MAGTTTSSNLSRGDAAAQADDWSIATTEWSRALRSDDRGAAAARLTWFLDQEHAIARPVDIERRARRRAYRWVVVAIVGSIAGTILVFININGNAEPGGPLSGLAWICYLVAMAATLIFARRTGQAGSAATNRPVNARIVDKARSIAREVDNQKRAGRSPSRRSARRP